MSGSGRPGHTGQPIGVESAVTAILEGAEQRLLSASRLGVRERIAYWAIAAALLLHVVIAVFCIVDWAALLDLALAGAEVPEAIPVTLVYEPPPAPKPEAQPPPPQPQPQAQPRPAVTPRMSGEDEKTEAKAEDTPRPALPQPKSPPPEPTQQQKKPTPAPAPQRAGNREPASLPPASSAEREAATLEPEAKRETTPGPLFHSIRLPSQHGGTGERDTAGDAYLNRMRDLVEKHRIYPPASAFLGSTERVAVLSILIDPEGNLVQTTLLDSSGSTIADEAAGNMIRSAAPFPPLPASYPHIRTLITVEMPIYPH